MLVNPSKTNLLCITPSTTYQVSCFITPSSGNQIESKNTMTMLGFSFSDRPNVSAHVDLIKKKFNCRSRLIRHLKQAGLPDKDIVQIFKNSNLPSHRIYRPGVP